MKDLIVKLQSIGVIKFGNFEIKKDFISPFQIDFSGIISHPQIAKEICTHLFEKAQHFSFDLLCGVPTTGACFANFIAWNHDLPLVLRRSETKKMSIKIEGSYKTGQRCLVIQDLHLSGQHTLETIENLEDEGIKVHDALAFIDMEMGGKKKIKSRGFSPHAIIGVSEVLQILFESGKLPGDHFKLSTDFLENV